MIHNDLPILRRALTHEQVWIIRDEYKRGVLNATKRAREWNVSPATVMMRAHKDDPIWYPPFYTLEHAKIVDNWLWLRKDIAT